MVDANFNACMTHANDFFRTGSVEFQNPDFMARNRVFVRLLR